MQLERERYLHLFCCAEWLNEAWALLQRIRENPESPLAGAALRYASILYAKPYKFSHGDYDKHKIDGRYIPVEFIELHKRLVDDRDRVHAHTDIKRMDAMVEPIHFQDGTRASISRSIIYPPAILENIDQFILLIEGTIDALEIDLRLKESQLRVSSPRESHPQALPEPDVNLSIHPAPIVQSS